MRDYHRIVQEGITEFGSYQKGKNILSFTRGGEKLVIGHRTKNLAPITFKPDRIFTLNNRSRVAFQILGSQAKKKREIEADILRAYLYPAISKLVFIVSTESEADEVSRITEIVQDGLENLGVKEGLHLFLTITIPVSMSPSEIGRSLNNPSIIKALFAKT